MIPLTTPELHKNGNTSFSSSEIAFFSLLRLLTCSVFRPVSHSSCKTLGQLPILIKTSHANRSQCYVLPEWSSPTLQLSTSWDMKISLKTKSEWNATPIIFHSIRHTKQASESWHQCTPVLGPCKESLYHLGCSSRHKNKK